jgi:hypothetical protein
MDIVLGGNFYESKPETGIYDASYGLLLKGNGSIENLHIRGAVRDIVSVKAGKNSLLLWAMNNRPLIVTNIP